ncbi:MAG: radical SAM protein [Epulopiscium sp.]|nr:radical SAM protein [Candidatus Epulonipiscium sp.]
MLNYEKYMAHCTICPRACGVNRLEGQLGFCKAPTLPKIALVSSHAWEEPPISGTNGSGTVFFSHCNLQCKFCQNHAISEEGYGKEVSIHRLAEIFMEQQKRGCHNINLVSPTQYIPQICDALHLAKQQGLTIPVVYNTNGYESVSSLRLLEGYVDIYLPDVKYYDNALAESFSHAPNYFVIAQNALQEMFRQVGRNRFSPNGIMEKGIIIRHLVLPNCYKDSMRILDYISGTFGENTILSLLNQYTPMHKAKDIPALSRRLTTLEYQKVVNHFFSLGLKNGYTQKRSSSTSAYTPLFDGRGVEKSSP